jgi:adenine/guanine phosphoribosyltransferase-like PRPP-binding protein
MKLLIKAFDNQQIVRKNGKEYLLLPLTDHIVPTNPRILKQAVSVICKNVNWKGVNLIVSEEEKGGFIAVACALRKNIPFSLAKQNPVHVDNETKIEFQMAYNKNMTMYLNGVEKFHKVVVIDDFVDSGGTLTALIKAVKNKGAKIIDVVALAEKVNQNGVEKIKKVTGVDVKTIIKIDTSGKSSKVVNALS